MKDFLVLMSTYNGAKFLPQQIESILNQENISLDLVIRDDGSSDNTKKIIKDFQKKHSNVYLFEGKNIGPAQSFFTILFESKDYHYYSFSDQDDIWLPRKLFESKLLLDTSINKPSLYFSNEIYIDENNKVLAKSNKNKVYDKYEAFIRSNVLGCSIVFNNLFKLIIYQYKPLNVSMHDSYLFRLASSLGVNIILDKNAYIYYRLHNSNYSGLKLSLKDKINSSILQNKKIPVFKDLISIREGYHTILPKKYLEALDYFVNYKKSFKSKLVLIMRFIKFGNIFMKIKMIVNILFNRYY